MSQFLVRKLENSLVQKLRERAASAGVSMKEEHHRILNAALRGADTAAEFKAHLLAIPEGKPDRLFERKRTTSHRQTGF